jgi:hypothetical protein
MAKNDTKAFLRSCMDQLLVGRNPKTVLDSGGLIAKLKNALTEGCSTFEMDVLLEQTAEAEAGNHHNGSSSKGVWSVTV